MSNALERRSYILGLVTEITAAYVSNNAVPATELPELLDGLAETIKELVDRQTAPQDPGLVPAVPIKKSVTPDYIISLEDGARFKTMKRALMSRYGLTPEEYREKWGLPSHYPMVAPNYAKARSKIAKARGLGTRPSPKLNAAKQLPPDKGRGSSKRKS